MLEWRRICCPIDFSDASHHALRGAAELARRFGSELTLLFVYELPSTAPESLTLSPQDVLQAVLREYDRRLGEWKARAEHLCGCPVMTHLEVGTPAKEILRFVRDGRFDLVVMGTHGRTGLRHVVFGSVAEKVVRHAACPVLTLRPDARLESRASP
jgi:nucleotide-binding universal stress UspA family protein